MVRLSRAVMLIPAFPGVGLDEWAPPPVLDLKRLPFLIWRLVEPLPHGGIQWEAIPDHILIFRPVLWLISVDFDLFILEPGTDQSFIWIAACRHFGNSCWAPQFLF